MQRAATFITGCGGCQSSTSLLCPRRTVQQADESSPRTLVKPLQLGCCGGKVTLQLCFLPPPAEPRMRDSAALADLSPLIRNRERDTDGCHCSVHRALSTPCPLRRWELCRTPELLSPPLHVLSQILSGALNADTQTHSKPGCTEAPAESTAASSWCLCGCWRQKQVTSPWAVVSGWLLKCPLLLLQPVSSTQEPCLATPC